MSQPGEGEAGGEKGLTAQGWEDVAESAELAARLRVAPAEIFHGRGLPALETADILGRRFGVPRVEAAGLMPEDPVDPWVERFNGADRDQMIVAGRAFLERLCSRLMTGSQTMEVARFPEGGIVCLERENDGQWEFLWTIWPEMARGLQPALPV